MIILQHKVKKYFVHSGKCSTFAAAFKRKNAQVVELVDAHVSGACSERSAGSSPVPGTKEILQVVQNERKAKSFFFYVSILATFWPPFRKSE